jgi:dephospho-CoA kinase
MRVIGLTGGIGSGKSEIARMFDRRGIPVINADKLSREVVEAGSQGLRGIIKRFGKTVLRGDGSLDRKGLAARVFKSDRERRDLEAILHPLIRARAEAHLGVHEDGSTPVVLLESPLLFEARQDDMCDAVICVVAREELRAKRVKRRDGMHLDDFKLRDAAQMSDDARRRLADIVIENNGSLEDLRRAVNSVKI